MGIHLALGFLAAWFPTIGVLALIYQVGQLLFGVRIFPLEGKIKSGNSVAHTAMKIGEIGIGYLVGKLIRAR